MRRSLLLLPELLWVAAAAYGSRTVVPADARAGCQWVAQLLRPMHNSEFSSRVDDFLDDADRPYKGCEINYQGTLQGPQSIREWLERHGWKSAGSLTASPDGDQIELIKANSLCRILTTWPDSNDDTVHPPIRVICSEKPKEASPGGKRIVAEHLHKCPAGTYPQVSLSGALICCSDESGCD